MTASLRLAVCAALLLASSAVVHAQTTQFAFQPARVAVGNALHYEKSTLDGSKVTYFSVYVRDRERLESLKWDDGSSSALLVEARMDWQRFSIRDSKTWRLARERPPELQSTLESNHDGSELRVSFMRDKTVKINRWPWHSYDFDFASLGMTLPHLRNPEADVIFWRTDVVFVGESVDFTEIGGVRLHFEATETRNERELRRYSIGGAGLAHQYGKIWTDFHSGQLVEYQIPIGHEPGYKDVRVVLDRIESMEPSQWEEFKQSKAGGR